MCKVYISALVGIIIWWIFQIDETKNSLFIILQVHCTCFRCQPHPSSGVRKIVTRASGTGHIFCAATSLQRDQAWPRWREAAAQYRRLYLYVVIVNKSRPQWPLGLRRRSTVARLLRLWVPFPMGAWVSVCFKCWVLSGSGLCGELITRPEESYRFGASLCVV